MIPSSIAAAAALDNTILAIAFGCIGVAAIGFMLLAESYRRRALMWRDRSQHWFSVAMGEKPLVDETGAKRLMRDLFPRPMGAVPSTERDAQSARAWRERRAVMGRDHLTRHSVEAHCDSEAATEILMFTVGGWEVDR